MMKRVTPWMVIFTEIMHLFCCVLPIVSTIIFTFTSVGTLGIIPVWLIGYHHLIHDYESYIIVLSAMLLIISYILTNISQRIDCYNTGCKHPPCGDTKKQSVDILIIGVIIFIINCVIYVLHFDWIEVI